MIQHHKHLSLDLLLPAGFGSSSTSSTAAASGAVDGPPQQRQHNRLRSKAGRSTDVLDSAERAAALPSQLLRVDGRLALVSLTQRGLEWRPPGATVGGSSSGSSSGSTEALPFSEMLAIRPSKPRSAAVPLPACCLPCLPARPHRCEVLTFRRRSPRCEWAPRRLLLEAADEETAHDWCAAIAAGIEAASAQRPRSLLVILNPKSGRHRARSLYTRTVAPLFAAAGVRATVRETQRPGHAAELVGTLSTAELRDIDGIVCVGGDGVFHEALNGVLHARGAAAAAAAAASASGAGSSSAASAAELSALLSGLRLAHIPAGSTDAVACTLHGSRDPFTAAMHVCLGDALALDILRVDCAAGPKFASCIAAFGFLADVCAAAEGYRALGPLRYDVVGALKLLASRSYPARISYLEGEVGRELSRGEHAETACGAGCGVCRAASFIHSRRFSEQRLAAAAGDAGSSSASSSPQASPSAAGGGGELPESPLRGGAPPAGSSHFLQHAASAAERHAGEEWRVLEGEWASIMLICMPCRSDKTKAGMARYGHLADGRMKLVLVRKCSPLQYLRFLASMAASGCAPGQLPYVTVLDAVAARVEPLAGVGGSGGGSSGGGGILAGSSSGGGARQSCWNLDGELLRGPDMRIAAEAHHGAVRVFSRGVE